MGPTNPFNPKRFLTRPLTRSLAGRPRPDPLALLAHLQQGGARGLVLLESAGGAGPLPTLRRSILTTRALLRIELREGAVKLSLLEEAAAPLLEALQEVLPDHFAPPSEGGEENARLRAPSPLDALRGALALLGDAVPAPFPAGLFGAFSYELVDRFEQLPPRKPDPLDEPDFSFVLAGDLLVIDHQEKSATLITRGLPFEQAAGARARHARLLQLLSELPAHPARCGPAALPGGMESNLDQAAFQEGVRQFQEAIRAGEIFQGVLARGLEIPCAAPPLAVYGALRARNPSPYMFFMDLPDGALLGASPEMALRVEQGLVELRPIAGTRPRGRRASGELDFERDGRLALSLLLDPKEQAEHAMLLDLARNDVARISRAGSQQVLTPFSVERYQHVQHLVSRVRGRLKPGLDALHAYRAVANMGTLTGAPKLRAMELIRETEPHARGFYGGALGCLLQDGSLDTCIVIRSLRQKGGRYHLKTGAGIVKASRPEAEFQETEHKARACLEALALAGRTSP